MSDKVFVDTHILLYARDAGQPVKQPIAQSWLAALWDQRSGRLSFQVLQEYYVNVTQKLKPGLPIERARQDVRALMLWNPVVVDAALLESAWKLADLLNFRGGMRKLSPLPAVQIAPPTKLSGCGSTLNGQPSKSPHKLPRKLPRKYGPC